MTRPLTVKVTGSYKGALAYLQRLSRKDASYFKNVLDSYGRMGVEALKQATPKDTGKTAESWYYVSNITKDGRLSLEWKNSNTVYGGNLSVAILIQYGHGLQNGGYVQGIDYINPALRPVFEEISRKIDMEVNT